MPAKLIIWCPGRPALNGHKRRTFQWSVQHNCFVHEGKELTEQEFNAKAELVFKKNQDLRPCVRVVQYSDAAPVLAEETAARVLELEAKITLLHARSAVPVEVANENAQLKAKVAELEAKLAAPPLPSVITLEQAWEVVHRLAPHKLKGQPGKKPAAVATPDEV